MHLAFFFVDNTITTVLYYIYSKEREINIMTDKEFQALADKANKERKFDTVAGLIKWLQQFPDDTMVSYGYATIEAYLDETNGKTTQRIIIEELA